MLFEVPFDKINAKKIFSKKISWLRLIRSAGIGPIRFWELLKSQGSAEAALDALLRVQPSRVYPLEKADQEYQAHLKQGYSLLAAFEPYFPQILKHRSDCPPLLSVYGDVTCLNQPMIAIVGGRNASLGGKQLSLQIATDLSQGGWQVVSGMARGIDERAHQGSLDQGTVAVLAGGVDCIYPFEHTKLYHEIAKKGAVVSEMPLSTQPLAPLFPRRNRLIAGLSRGIVVIEAALKSGSLITADYGLEQGVDIFAVPGSPLDPRCLGSNHLLKQGAILAEKAEDVFNVLGVFPKENERIGKYQKERERQETVEEISFTKNDLLKSGKTKDQLAASEDQQLNNAKDASSPLVDLTPVKLENANLREQLLNDLSPTPIDFDSLAASYPHPSSLILAILSELEMEGLIQRYLGNKFSLL